MRGSLLNLRTNTSLLFKRCTYPQYLQYGHIYKHTYWVENGAVYRGNISNGYVERLSKPDSIIEIVQMNINERNK